MCYKLMVYTCQAYDFGHFLSKFYTRFLEKDIVLVQWNSVILSIDYHKPFLGVIVKEAIDKGQYT